MSTFLQLYGVELDRELGSSDTSQLFTLARRKAAINAGQLEFAIRTECFTKQTTVSLIDETQEYDLESTITDFIGISTQGVSIRITPATGSVRYIEGDDFDVTSVERLTFEEPGWRAASASTPTRYYIRQDGGMVNLGFHPAPNITVGDTWVALVPYVLIPVEMTADADVPFTIVSALTNAVQSLRPYHRAIVHFAAHDLEKLRKDTERSLLQLKLFEAEVEKYIAKQKPKGGQTVRYVGNYRGRSHHSRLDPRVYP